MIYPRGTELNQIINNRGQDITILRLPPVFTGFTRDGAFLPTKLSSRGTELSCLRGTEGRSFLRGTELSCLSCLRGTELKNPRTTTFLPTRDGASRDGALKLADIGSRIIVLSSSTRGKFRAGSPQRAEP
jgi:hypothetical protein